MKPEDWTEALRLTAEAHRQLDKLNEDIDRRLRSAKLDRDARRIAELGAIQTYVRRVRTLVGRLGWTLRGDE